MDVHNENTTELLERSGSFTVKCLKVLRECSKISLQLPAFAVAGLCKQTADHFGKEASPAMA